MTLDQMLAELATDGRVICVEVVRGDLGDTFVVTLHSECAERPPPVAMQIEVETQDLFSEAVRMIYDSWRARERRS